MTHLEQSPLGRSHNLDGALKGPTGELERIRHPGANLSARERMIVLLMGNGLSNKEIARQLCIMPETVKSHAKSVFLKLTARSRAQAVYLATTLGLI